MGMFSLKTIVLACALFSVGFSGGSSSKKSCKALAQPQITLNNKISALSESDIVKLYKLDVELKKQENKDEKNASTEQGELLAKEYAVKGDKEKFKQCVQAQKDLDEAQTSASNKRDKIKQKFEESKAGKDANNWQNEVYGRN